jgi:hypothetical protein
MKLRHVIPFLLLSIAILSCKSEDLSSTPLPECLSELIDTVPSQVFVQRHNAELHYWMRGGALADRDEPIVNAVCDTVCYFGGWIHPPCLEEYGDDWTLIWPG